MTCEGCGSSIDGSYGSGRFCNARCARGFSTRAKRGEINERISEKLKGNRVGGRPFVKGYDVRRGTNGPHAEIVKGKIAQGVREHYRIKIASTSFEQLSKKEKKRAILVEQGGVCLHCGLSEWRGLPLTLELDHVDGNHDNDARDNLRVLCPNCHSQTPTYRRYKYKTPDWSNGKGASLKHLISENAVLGSSPRSGTRD